MLYIAKNKDAMLESLFVPAPHGGTYDGFIAKRTKNTVRLTIPAFGEYLINKYNVLCSVGKTSDGKPFYTFADFRVQDAIGSYSEVDEWCRELKKA